MGADEEGGPGVCGTILKDCFISALPLPSQGCLITADGGRVKTQQMLRW